MDKERINLKWILIVFLVTLFLAPAQSAFASNWAFNHHRGNSPKHHYAQHHNNQHRFNQYRYNEYRSDRHLAIRYRNNHYPRYRVNAHFGHNHGLIAPLLFISDVLFVRSQKFYHHHGVYYKKSRCGYYVVPDPY